jgi:hypothetical protein
VPSEPFGKGAELPPERQSGTDARRLRSRGVPDPVV